MNDLQQRLAALGDELRALKYNRRLFSPPVVLALLDVAKAADAAIYEPAPESAAQCWTALGNALVSLERSLDNGDTATG